MSKQVDYDSAQTQDTGRSDSVVARHSHGREKAWTQSAENNEPRRLLDLPLDILQAIVREVTHTNDLTALALTHSALHEIVIPHIYSRFDIVWPDANPTVESRVGVDALTYGLATLVMAQDVFGEAPYQQAKSRCNKCGHSTFCQHSSVPSRPRKIRRGNYFARYTRKFSLGNGPSDWVQEYLITKEGGKMLGTLVALAVGRMRNLESFVWDMPTGVLRDVWLALASLGDREDGQECRLEKVWVRWHDNQDHLPISSSQPHTTMPIQASDLPSLLNAAATPLFHVPHYPRVEFPTFSILPPLKSLSVLDVDELPYVEEMSVLIERSLGQLQELRVGIARHAQRDPWTRPREDRSVIMPSLTYPNDQQPRSGGMLGILVGRFISAFGPTMNRHSGEFGAESVPVPASEVGVVSQQSSKAVNTSKSGDDLDVPGISQLQVMLSAQSLEEEPQVTSDMPEATDHPALDNRDANISTSIPITTSETFNQDGKETQSRRLKLSILELERVYLSISVLSQAFDWSRLVTLTILGCYNHEQLWKALRKHFAPSSRSRSSSISKISTPLNSTPPRSGKVSSSSLTGPPEGEYKLRITRIHTDAVSPALLAFIKDALAPDSLEWLFLQQSESYKSVMTIEQIYKCAVRRHRGSLRKLLIDSEYRSEDGPSATSWRKWAFNRELITCMTSGRMQLRELSMSVDYKDWHYFLQRLPQAATLRSLHITHIVDPVHGRIDAREAALQVLDIVALRPELELCYLGVQNKCFEVLEYTNTRKPSPSSSRDHIDITTQTHIESDDNDSEDHDQENDHDDHGDGFNDEDSDDELNIATDQDYDDDETEDEDNDVSGQKKPPKPSFRLREILFYDDKISIFKARHGRL